MHEVGGPDHATTEQLSALLDDRAETGEERFLSSHVPACVACTNELDDLRAVRDLLSRLPIHQPPRSFTIPVPAIARAATEAPRPIRRFRVLVPLTRTLGALAAVLCVVLFSVDAMRLADAPSPRSDTGAALQIAPARAPAEAAKAVPKSAAEEARAADAAKPAEPAQPAAAARPAESKPAAAFAPAPTQAPALQTPSGGSGAPAAKPAADARAASAPTAAAPAPAQAAAPPPQATQSQTSATSGGPAATPTAAPALAAQPRPAAPAAAPQAPATSTTSFSATQPPIQATAGLAAATTPPPPAGEAPSSRSSQFEQTTGRSAQPVPSASAWFTSLRVWSAVLAVLAAGLLVGSFVLNRAARSR
ncbi:MAG: hypothetical protein U0893_13250 [Chloroflexota bacterium]